MSDDLAVDARHEPPRRHLSEWEVAGRVGDACDRDRRYIILTAGDTAWDARGRGFVPSTETLYPEARLMTHLAHFHGAVVEPDLTDSERRAVLERARAAR
jgi:hypothetical protein